MLSLEDDAPQIVLDGQEYTVMSDPSACLLDEQIVYDAFPDEGYEECALEHINLMRLYELTRIVSTESLSPVASRMLKYASPVDLRVPAMENFKNPNINRSVTKIAKESILENVWKAIKKIFAAIGEFFKNLFISSDKIDKKIESISEETVKVIRRGSGGGGGGKKQKTSSHKEDSNVKEKSSIAYHDLKAEINDSVNSRMSSDGAVASVTFPKENVDPDIKKQVIGGYSSLYILSTQPDTKIEYVNLKTGSESYVQLFKKIEGSIKTTQSMCDKLTEHMDYVNKLTNDSQQDAQQKHEEFVSEINGYCESIISSIFTEKPQKGDRLENFTDYVPGLIRWGATLTPKEGHVSQLVIGKRCYSDLSHIPPDQCYIEPPNTKLKSSVDVDSVSISNTAANTSTKFTPIIERIGKEFEPYSKDQPSESNDSELDKLRREMYGDIITTIRNLSSISANLYASTKQSFSEYTRIRLLVLMK